MKKELPIVEDLRSQIMKLIEHLPHGFTEFDGMNVMEAGDYDTMCECIDEALRQAMDYGKTIGRISHDRKGHECDVGCPNYKSNHSIGVDGSCNMGCC